MGEEADEGEHAEAMTSEHPQGWLEEGVQAGQSDEVPEESHPEGDAVVAKGPAVEAGQFPLGQDSADAHQQIGEEDEAQTEGEQPGVGYLTEWPPCDQEDEPGNPCRTG